MSGKRYTPSPNPAYCADYDEHSEQCKNCNIKSVDITTTIILQECAAFYDVFKGLEKRLENSGIVETPPEHRNPTLSTWAVAMDGLPYPFFIDSNNLIKM